MSIQELGIRFKPGVPKRQLLLVAAFVWFFAGGMLLYRGIIGVPHGYWHVWEVAVSIAGGLVFFWVLFYRISSSHIRRITSLDILRPCVFSFFNFRSYLLMSIMITMGVSVRKLHLVNAEVISYFYITMAAPLLLSAVRFLWAWKKYDVIIKEGY
jgi:hypothetical protein